ncbi:hypothetical protein JHD46_03015 [Sulfurimonas sp. SAG-AH-194-C20]|nr:hypothetical protein [Sulfurimonas sp. SAG-AH-194-C20]MDF1878605.1 hypothetical protein [Sulfurimonas sp. SAG-AH-194-C20]
MKIIVSILALGVSLIADIDVSGHIDFDSQFYLKAPKDKNSNSFTSKQILELTYEEGSLSIFTKLYAQEAYYDFYSKDKNTKRTFARIDELYLKYDFDDDALKAGKSIEFWGSLELRNIVDGFNPADFRNDLFSKDKLGVYNIAYSHYFENSELSLISKPQEEQQFMANQPYVYYFFPSFVSYDGTLKTQESKNRPSLYLKFSGSTDTEYAIDYAFIYENGYDSQRYFTTNTPQNLIPTSPTFGQTTRFEENVYLVNKFMTYNTLVVGSTLLKLEGLYAQVDGDSFVGDYSHLALGIEHTLENIVSSHSLGLIGEYYRYDTYQSDKYDDLELFETMQNDLFIGMRYTLNNTNDSSFVGGGIFDLDYDEQVYYLKFESRVEDSFKVALDYYYIEPSTTKTTAYALLGEHQKLGINIAYYF